MAAHTRQDRRAENDSHYRRIRYLNFLSGLVTTPISWIVGSGSLAAGAVPGLAKGVPLRQDAADHERGAGDSARADETRESDPRVAEGVLVDL